MRIFNRIPLHPLLFSVYPILALLAHNMDQIKPTAAWRSLLVVTLGIMVLYLVLFLVFRDRHFVAVICTLFIVLFFSYGHVYEYLNQLDTPLMAVARHRYLLPIWLVICVIGLWLVRRYKSKIQTFTTAFNIVAIIAVSLPILQIIIFQLRTQQAFTQKPESTNNLSTLTITENETLPDIYYIILDAYMRDDILQEHYQYDNTPFLQELANLGFYIAQCSQSNYAQTELSMASAFNMDYLEALGDRFEAGSNDRSDLWPLLRHGRVRQMLETIGYEVIAFETGYYWLHWEDADHYLAPPKNVGLGILSREGGLNSFEVLLMETSALRVVFDTTAFSEIFNRLLPGVSHPEKIAQERTLFALDQLQSDHVPAIQGPKFIYAHIIAPHPPYVFGRNGEIADPGEEFTYVDQVIYINHRIIELVEGIMEKSENPPIIILQGDHGLRQIPQERVAILNAYYLPNVEDQLLYPWISPVNTFRVIFDYYIGGELGLLEDISYFSKYDLPYDYEIVPNLCREEVER